ncbi:MAG: glycosyltransferase family 4 protein [Deltaproteobacteria bacterium]|nr:glycosyltransferase family 4 protein [Deltaproteobacteria bacterium]MBW2152212.1 glycosyltransferase family 4 protein [Deltaproteobacteria bacterium]
MKRRSTILFLLPPDSVRLNALESVLKGETCAERYLFYGLDFFIDNNIHVKHNLTDGFNYSRIIGKFYRLIIRCLGGYAGNLDWLIPVWKFLWQAQAIVAYSDRIMFPLLYMMISKLCPWKPVLYIPIGLPEKICYFSNPFILNKFLYALSRLARIVPLSYPEAKILQEQYGVSGNIKFIPAGVDTKYFYPEMRTPVWDVVSIGADRFRDFFTLFDAARRLKNSRFLVITSKEHASRFQGVPANVQVNTDVPMSEIREYLSLGSVVALPVQDNTYSGGTTVMLQSMAMGKTVVANRIGANVSGYGFVDGKNCLFIPPQNPGTLAEALSFTLLNKEFRSRLGATARDHVVRHLDINIFHRKLFSMVKEICPDLTIPEEKRYSERKKTNFRKEISKTY